MKKLLLAVFAVCALSAASFAGGWGLGVKLGAGQNDPKDMKNAFDYYGGKITKAPGVFAVEGLYEWDLAGETLETTGSVNKLGLRFGFDVYGQNKWEKAATKVEENTASLPITVYYKRDNGIKGVNYYVGGGLTFISTEMEITNNPDLDNDKWFPHVMVGAEYRFTKLFALGLDFKYNFNAKLKKNDIIISDRSGFQGALAARFYF